MYLRLMMACICAYSFWVKSWPFRNAAVACLAFDIRTIAYHSVLCTIRLFQCQSNNRTTTTGRNIIFRPHTGLKRYKILSLVGDGTYGLVYLAINSETREKVSNNCQTKMGYRSENTCFFIGGHQDHEATLPLLGRGDGAARGQEPEEAAPPERRQTERGHQGE